MLKILVTGANGFVGEALCSEAAARGLHVTGVTRNERLALPGCDKNFVISSLDDQTDWGTALEGIDVVIHLAARVHVMQDQAASPLLEFRRVNTMGTEHLARCAAASGVKRLVYVSSIKVNGEATLPDDIYTESSPPQPCDPYGISKWEAEQRLHEVARETGLEVVVVRPPLVYGPKVKGNFLQMLKAVDRSIPLPLKAVANQRDLLFVGNLVDALLLCASHPDATGNTYLLSDGEAISTPGLLQRLASALDKPSRLLRIPPGLLHAAGKLLGISAQLDRLLGSLRIDSGKIRRELSWKPPFTLQQGLQATAMWYKGQNT